MVRYSLRTFWLILFFAMFLASSIYSVVEYTLDYNNLAKHEKNEILREIDSFTNDLSLLIDKNDSNRIFQYIKSSSEINNMIFSLTLVKNDKVYFSSNSNYIGKDYNSFNCIGIDKFMQMQELDADRTVCKSLITKSLSGSEHYILIVEINPANFQKYLSAVLSYKLIAIFTMSVVSLFMLIFMLNKILINPINIINKKLEKKDFTYSNFPLIDIDNIDKSIFNSIKEIHSKNILLDSIINQIDDLIFFKDKDFKYFGCNNAFLKFVGKSKEEMIGHDDFELFPHEMAKLFREMDIKMLREKKTRSNYEWVIYPNGTKVYLLTQKIPFYYNGDGDAGILGISRDLTELHLVQKEIEDQAYIDELTKVNNRKSFNKRIEEYISLFNRYKTPFSILMYDIDDFKKINDEFGHNIGDEVLVQMSKLVQSCIRENDHLFRIGGEEFIVLFPQTSIKQAKIVAEKIRESVENSLDTINKRKITISIGLTEVQEGDTEDIIFKRVDELLYRSKKEGKNRVSC